MALNKQELENRVGQVIEPQTGRPLADAGLLQKVSWCDGAAFVRIALPSAAYPLKEQLHDSVEEAIRAAAGDEPIQQINIELQPPGGQAPSAQAGSNEPSTPQSGGQSGGQDQDQPAGQPSSQQAARDSNPLPDVKHIIAVGAGKGGVGKSTISVNLAIGLARQGYAVGLLDGDIYGPSTPTLLGLHDATPQGTSKLLFPFYVHGIKTMTIGKLVPSDKALIWRGPMAHGAFRQLSLQTDWGELDYLIVDLPPGTGDVPLTLAQMLPVSGAVVVCTPQRVAQDDAVRSVKMFEQLEIPVLGVVENMSYFIGDDGKEYDIFGRGGAAAMAEKLELPLLGTVPIHMELRANGDAGDPRANFEGNPKLAEELGAMAEATRQRVEALGAEQPGLSVH